MKLYIVRHGDPDYAADCLTERGRREAELLADRLEKLDFAAIYVSPLGRARETAQATLGRLGRQGETKEWLREFAPRRFDPDAGRETVIWDWLPQSWTSEKAFYDREGWMHVPVMEASGVPAEAKWVYDGLDEVLEKHGYRHEGDIFRSEKPNRDSILFFCHFGVECVMLGHLLGISPMRGYISPHRRAPGAQLFRQVLRDLGLRGGKTRLRRQEKAAMHDELTKVDIQKMQEEIDYRLNTLRPKLIEDVQVARSFGDLSENFEYKAAKQAKNRNDSRIRYLQNMIATAVVIEDRHASEENVVGLFDFLTVWFEEDEEEQRIRLVTTLRQNPMEWLISKESPLGKALMGRKAGEKVLVEPESGESYHVVIRAIEKGEDDESLEISRY